MNTRKNYIKPKLEIIKVESMNVIASSLQINGNSPEISGPARSKEFWNLD